MSVYIKGADKPLGCGNCFYDSQCDIWRIRNWGMPPPENCPIIQVSAHGRLVDAEAMQDSLADLLRFPSNLVNAQWIVNTLREMPTVIPAYRRDGE